jgi:16S rRNA (guanine1207-N2)-methyltransferase
MRDVSIADYHQFHVTEARVGNRVFQFVSKPGIASWDTVDTDTRLLVDCVQVLAQQKILCVGCRHGLIGVVIAGRRPDAEYWLLNSSVVATRAAQRTKDLHGLSQVRVVLSDGLWEVRDQRFDQVLINLPKGKLLVRQLIWDAFCVLNKGGRLYLSGGTREGIKPCASLIEGVFGNADVVRLGGRHRVISAVKHMDEISKKAHGTSSPGYYTYTQFNTQVHGRVYCVVSKPGVFSWDRVDMGTRLLLDHMVIGEDDTVLDLGAGNGLLGVVAATLAPRGHAYLVDSSVAAVSASARTIAANDIANATAMLSDVGSDVRRIAFDAVVTNLPFHVGVNTDDQVARQFIKDAQAMLNVGGRLYLVANRFLKYEPHVTGAFGNCRVLYRDDRYKVLGATKTARF